jgi:metallo-beta-lactamase class B
MRLADPQYYPGIRGDFERTFRIARDLPGDIWVTSHARAFGRYRKFTQRGATGDSAAPFIDRAGYLAYIDSGEARFRKLLAEQQAKR